MWLLTVDTCARDRWYGSLYELVEAFQPEVTCVKFMTWRAMVALPKSRNRASGLRDIQQILGHRLLFRRLRALHDKLCFRDTGVTAALNIISEQRRWFYERSWSNGCVEYRLERNVQTHAPRHSTSDDLFAKRSVAAQALGHTEKSSQEHARASGRNGAGRRNADPRRLANAGGRRATAEAEEHA